VKLELDVIVSPAIWDDNHERFWPRRIASTITPRSAMAASRGPRS